MPESVINRQTWLHITIKISTLNKPLIGVKTNTHCVNNWKKGWTDLKFLVILKWLEQNDPTTGHNTCIDTTFPLKQN